MRLNNLSNICPLVVTKIKAKLEINHRNNYLQSALASSC